MSQKEFQRVKVIENAAGGRLSVREASRPLCVYRGDFLLLTQPLTLEEHADRRPAPLTTAQKRKTPMPGIYILSGRPAIAAVTDR